MPVDETTARALIAEWKTLAEKRPDPRKATKDALIAAFQTKRHMEEGGASNIAAAVLYYAMTSGHEQAFTDVLKAGGHCLLARITNEGGKMYRFRAEIIPVM